MARRLTPLINGNYYHIFNRGVEKRPIFSDNRSYRRFIETLNYYRFINTPLKLSNFFKLSLKNRSTIIKDLRFTPTHVTICCFALMHNHFHLLLRQNSDNGISKFMKNLGDSYTKYFNTRRNRIGPLFQGQFKAVRVESDDQLSHVSRYIHLNPYSSCIVKNIDDLLHYPWTSLPIYAQTENNLSICDISPIMQPFKTWKAYWKFISDHADYQKKLENIKHITLEYPDVRS